MKCVILCGGKGERLMPLTATTKKAYLRLGEKRVIDHITDRLPVGMRFSVSMNDGGALAALAEVARGGEPIMVVCGDNYFSDNLGGFVNAFDGNALIGVYDVHDSEKAKQYGVVELYPSGRVKSLIEKPCQTETTLVSAGIYIFPPNVFSNIHEMSTCNPHGNLGDVIIRILKSDPVCAYAIQGAFFDIGTLQGYEAASRFENSRLLQISRQQWAAVN